MTCIRGEEPAWLSWFPVREYILEGARPGEVVLVDVAGGRGHDGGAFTHRFEAEFPEGGRVVLEDLPAVLADAGESEGENDEKGVGRAVEKVAYDFFRPQVVEGEFHPSIVPLAWDVTLFRSGYVSFLDDVKANPTSRRSYLLLCTHSARLVRRSVCAHSSQC